MNINLAILNTKKRVDFKGSPDLSKYYNDEIKDIKDLLVEGTIIDNDTSEYEVNMHIKGTIILSSSINGSDVPENIDVEYSDFIENLVENYKNGSNSLDILPIIWENILLEVPIRAVNEDDTFEVDHGNGWEIVSK